MAQFYENSVFWIEVDKISPNPYQPRREFDEEHLRSLANSIRQYGVLQALVVTRQEIPKEDGGMAVLYELVSGERRLRAAKLAGVSQVPVLIKTGEESDLMKLELAIIENIQREDLNPVERARAFHKLSKEFGFTHVQIAEKMGKSREYVSNTLRILSMPEEILDGLSAGKITEGHTRPLMMLSDRPAEQSTLFKEIVYKKISVREAERIAKKIAQDKVRKREFVVDPAMQSLEKQFTEFLGTRVHIERKEVGGKLSIDFFSSDDLNDLLELVKSHKNDNRTSMLDRYIMSKEKGTQNNSVDQETISEVSEVQNNTQAQPENETQPQEVFQTQNIETQTQENNFQELNQNQSENVSALVDQKPEDTYPNSDDSMINENSVNPNNSTEENTVKSDEDEDLYSIRNFTV